MFLDPKYLTTFSVKNNGEVWNVNNANTPSHRYGMQTQQQNKPGDLLIAHRRLQLASFFFTGEV